MAASRPQLRPPLAVTLAVWRALFVRETLARISRFRFAWLWVIAEPAGHIAVLMLLFGAGLKGKVVAGGDIGQFIMLGILGFFMVRNIMNRCMDAIDSSHTLFAFRQILPADTVLVRAVSEGVLNCMLFIVLLTDAGMFGVSVIPHVPIGALAAAGPQKARGSVQRVAVDDTAGWIRASSAADLR